MMGRLIQIVRLAGRFVLRAILAGAVLFLLAVGVGPRTGMYRTLTVLTASMKPGMAPGSMAVVVPIKPSAIRVGDVLTFEAPLPDRPVVTHRVVEIVERGAHPVIRTRGDANGAPDPWTARVSGSTAWRRVAVIPRLGMGIHSLRSPVVHKATVYLVPALLAIALLVGIWSGEGETDDAPPDAAPDAPFIGPIVGRLGL
jgi:signal peptidase